MTISNLAVGQTIIARAFPKKLKISNDSGKIGLLGGKKAEDAFKHLKKLLDGKDIKGVQKKKDKIKKREMEIKEIRNKTYDILDSLVTYIENFLDDVDEFVDSREEELQNFMESNVITISSRQKMLISEFAGADVIKITGRKFYYDKRLKDIEPPKKMIFAKDATVICDKSLKLPEELIVKGELVLNTYGASHVGIETKVIKAHKVIFATKNLNLKKNTAITTKYFLTYGYVPANLTTDFLEISDDLVGDINIPLSVKMKKLIAPLNNITNMKRVAAKNPNIDIRNNGGHGDNDEYETKER